MCLEDKDENIEENKGDQQVEEGEENGEDNNPGGEQKEGEKEEDAENRGTAFKMAASAYLAMLLAMFYRNQ